MKIRLIAALLGVSAFVFVSDLPSLPLSAQPPTAAVHAPLKAQFLHWAQFPIRVYIQTSNTSQKAEAQTALSGLDEWVAASHGKIRYVLAASPGEADIAVKFEPVAYLSAETKTVGETTVIFSGLILKKASIRLAEGNSVPGNLQSAAAHEFGHALGIQNHSDDPDDLMFPTETTHFSMLGDPLFEPPHAVTAHDLRLLRTCYPQLFAVTTSH
ncbi:MAG: matrixin family metalloprotease [Janthinobacterium lividum]